MPISQELGDVLLVLAKSIRSEDPFTEVKCLRKLDQNRVTVAVWTFDDVAKVLKFPEDIVERTDNPNRIIGSIFRGFRIRADKMLEFQATRMGEVLACLEKVAHGVYSPGGRESLYWDGWDKETSETATEVIQDADTRDLTETIKLYDLLQRDPLALNRWIGFGLGLVQATPDADPPSEDG